MILADRLLPFTNLSPICGLNPSSIHHLTVINLWLICHPFLKSLYVTNMSSMCHLLSLICHKYMSFCCTLYMSSTYLRSQPIINSSPDCHQLVIDMSSNYIVQHTFICIVFIDMQPTSCFCQFPPQNSPDFDKPNLLGLRRPPLKTKFFKKSLVLRFFLSKHYS